MDKISQIKRILIPDIICESTPHYISIPYRNDIKLGDIPKKTDKIVIDGISNSLITAVDDARICIDDDFIYDFLIKKNIQKYKLDKKYPISAHKFRMHVFLAGTHSSISCYAYSYDKPKVIERETFDIGITKKVCPDLIFKIDDENCLAKILCDIIDRYEISVSFDVPLGYNHLFLMCADIIHERMDWSWDTNKYITRSTKTSDLPMISDDRITYHGKKIKYYWMKNNKEKYAPHNYHEMSDVSKQNMTCERIIMIDIDHNYINNCKGYDELIHNQRLAIVINDDKIKGYQILRDMNMPSFTTIADYDKKLSSMVELYKSGFFDNLNPSCPILHFHIEELISCIVNRFDICDKYVYGEVYQYHCIDLISNNMMKIDSKTIKCDMIAAYMEQNDVSIYDVKQTNEEKNKTLFDEYCYVSDKPIKHAHVHSEFLMFKYTIDKYFVKRIEKYTDLELYMMYKKLKYLEKYVHYDHVSVDKMLPKSVLRKMLKIKYDKKIEKQMNTMV
jgi:hypothetical protein